MNTIQTNLSEINNRILSFEQRYQRQPHSVKLLAVTKHQPIEKIQQAIDAEHKVFGENYLQEALPKINFFANQSVEWHFIGPIQSNKTKKIAEHFSWVHTVESEKIAKRLNDQRPDSLPPLNICIQVNISDENSKSGLPSFDSVLSLATFCRDLPRLRLRGLMTIPAPKKTFEEQRIELHKLKLFYDALIQHHFSIDTLSMGMSEDLEAAIAEGATVVRVGTAIFGARK